MTKRQNERWAAEDRILSGRSGHVSSRAMVELLWDKFGIKVTNKTTNADFRLTAEEKRTKRAFCLDKRPIKKQLTAPEMREVLRIKRELRRYYVLLEAYLA